MELRYHTDKSIFYDKDGKLEPAPKESLAELEKRYDDMCQAYHKFTAKMDEIKKKYGRTETNKDGTTNVVIDYDLWEKDDEDSFWTYGFADFNAGNASDEIQYKIDLKIMHINNGDPD